jgi:hypothetical protein
MVETHSAGRCAMKNMARMLASKLGNYALKYAAKGWHVFPLQPRGKQPIIKGGFLSATAAEDRIRDWWRDTPDANIGLWPGQSGLLVIDIDGPEGEETARALGVLSEPTLICTTGRHEGGRHLYFKRPDFNVSNCNIGKKLDVRCDGGYVILPPSIHPTGAQYTWPAKDAIGDLPPDALEAIRRAQLGIPRNDDAHASAARDIALQESIGDGERNNTLTRYAGRLLAKGLDEQEVFELVSSLNRDRCSPPLEAAEVNALVASIATKESKKRALQLVGDDHEPVREYKTWQQLAEEQTAAAFEHQSRDLSHAPRWFSPMLNRRNGPMMPNDFIVVGALSGNGKTTFLFSQALQNMRKKIPTLYLPLELEPHIARIDFAAWLLDLDRTKVRRQEWNHLGEGAREAHETMLSDMANDPLIAFPPPSSVSVGELTQWCKWGKEEIGARIVIVDHFNQMDHQLGDNYWTAVKLAARQLKIIARELDLVVICAAQIKREQDRLDKYFAPTAARLAETSALHHNADLLLMLSRRLRPGVTSEEQRKAKEGFIPEADLADPGVMVVTTRKHRLDDAATDRHVLLKVSGGQCADLVPFYSPEQVPERERDQFDAF